jgi:single-stranded-DNA-specific exonuclease
VDCGITAVEPAKVCAAGGCDYIVLDHHLPGSVIPQALAVVDPQREEDTSGLQNLCGAGLAFFFIMGLRAKLRDIGFFEEHPEPNLLKYLDLVAVATIADMADIRGVNRTLVTHGLRVLNRSPRPGFKAILDGANIKEVRSQHLGFVIGPRINAAGRLEHAGAALKLLRCRDPEEAKALALELETINAARRTAQDSVVEEARAQAATQVAHPQWSEMAKTMPNAAFGPWPRALVLAAEHWHEGVVGIVASKIMEEYKRPVFVLTRKDQNWKGSARSLGKVDIFAVMSEPAIAKLLTNFGGHAYAGGASLKCEDLETFRRTLNEHLALTTTAEHYHVARRTDLTLTEADLSPRQLGQFVGEIDTLEPFGLGFPEPAVKVDHVLARTPRVLKERHLKFTVGGVEALWFGSKETEVGAEILAGHAVDLWVSPQWNEWQGNRRLQLKVSHGERHS